MAWELPPSITRALDRLALSRVQRLEGDDNIVPTVQLLSLDQPPFQKAGHRFFGAGVVTSDATGGAVALSTTSTKCTVVVDSIVISVAPAAKVIISVGSGFLSGNVSVFVPAMSLSRPVPPLDARVTERLGTAGGATLYTCEIAAFMPVLFRPEIVLLVPPPSDISGDVYVAVNATLTGITLYVSYSGRIWYSEE